MQFAGMTFVICGIYDHVIYSCITCCDGEIKINSMFKWMNFAETGAPKVNLISINGSSYGEHNGITSVTISGIIV